MVWIVLTILEHWLEYLNISYPIGLWTMIDLSFLFVNKPKIIHVFFKYFGFFFLNVTIIAIVNSMKKKKIVPWLFWLINIS